MALEQGLICYHACMRLKRPDNFWSDGKKEDKYPPLKYDINCDIAIVGGGILGALVAYYLSSSGKRIVVVDKRNIGLGSTRASSALLVYQLDVNLSTLIGRIGRKNAVRVYKIYGRAIKQIKKLIKKHKIDAEFSDKKSLYLASRKKDALPLQREYKALKENGFKAKFLDKKTLENEFSISSEAAIMTYGSADLNPYLFTRGLFRYSKKRGIKIYSNTEIIGHFDENSRKFLVTSKGHKISAQNIIFCTGYESQKYLKKNVVSLKTSYTIATKPIKELGGHWTQKYHLWETARPYLYSRGTRDNRLIIGGEDDRILDKIKRNKRLPRKAKILKSKFSKFTNLDINPSYAWAATFGETKDGIGYIGRPKDLKDIYFALGFGGNGITFGVIAAQMIAKMILGKKTPEAKLFSFER